MEGLPVERLLVKELPLSDNSESERPLLDLAVPV